MFCAPLVGILLLLVTGVAGEPFVDAPYNPSYVWVPRPENSTAAYILSPRSPPSEGLQLQSLDLSAAFQIDKPPLRDLSAPESVLDGARSESLVSVTDTDGLPLIYRGSCQSAVYEISKFTPDQDDPRRTGKWRSITVSQVVGDDDDDDTELRGPNYLVSAVAFSHTKEDAPSDIFLFGGMCPRDDGPEQDWVSGAEYSRQMMLLLADGASRHNSYQLSTLPMRTPPVAEAGFSMTPLLPAYTNSSTGKQLTQQSFVMIGGHTREAFVGMSELALFSLPEASWTYIAVEQSPSAMLKTRAATRAGAGIEPRSGHTAVLSPGGDKIIVVGGWVGETSNAAEPQVAILRLGEEYGGAGSWTWDVPRQSPHGLPEVTGIFGHGAAMLPGGIMIVAGGYEIPSEPSNNAGVPRPNGRLFLFNTTSESWITTYDFPNQLEVDDTSNSGLLSSASQKAGLGVGVGVGVCALAALAIALYCHRTRHSRQHRKFREQELRKLALGAERPHFYGPEDDVLPPMIQSNPERSPFIPSSARAARSTDVDANKRRDSWENIDGTERAGLLVDTSSPTRNSQQGGWPGSQPTGIPAGMSTIRRVDERDEYQKVPLDESEQHHKRHQSKDSTVSDPFIDPPSPVKHSLAPPILPELPLLNDDTDGNGYSWLDSILLRHHNASPGQTNRTRSNLSERSGSGTSVSSGRTNQTALNRTCSHFLPPTWQLKQSPWPESGGPSHSPVQYGRDMYDHHDTSDRACQGVGGSSLVGQGSAWLTQPRSTLKTPTGPKGKAVQWAGNVRRAIGSIRKSEVAARPHSVIFEGGANYGYATGNQGSMSTTPTKSFHSAQEKMSDSGASSSSSSKNPRRALSISSSMLAKKQGARDWDVGRADGAAIRRNRTPGASTGSSDLTGEYPYEGYADDDEDWDVEAAAEGRVVQVTFTVPKEKLRVVNAGVGDVTTDDDDDESNNDDNDTHDRTKDKATALSGNSGN
ncbi:hypothetical protein VTO42DRAFT_2738 [Malbranchea cinnamomea]